MSKRIIKKFTFVTVRYDSDWQEYSVRPNIDKDDTRTAFDSDKQSIMDTAEEMDEGFRMGRYEYVRDANANCC